MWLAVTRVRQELPGGRGRLTSALHTLHTAHCAHSAHSALCTPATARAQQVETLKEVLHKVYTNHVHITRAQKVKTLKEVVHTNHVHKKWKH